MSVHRRWRGRPATGWWSDALGALDRLAMSRRYFTSDDLWDELGDNLPENPNQIGAVFNEVHNNRLIEPTGRIVKSSRPNAKKRNIQVWRSRLAIEGEETPLDQFVDRHNRGAAVDQERLVI